MRAGVSLVRPHMEYASVIWSPYEKKYCELLERMQSRFVRIIGFRLGSNYVDVPVHEITNESRSVWTGNKKKEP